MSTLPTSSPPRADSTPADGIVSSGWLGTQSIFGEYSAHQKQRRLGASVATVALHGIFVLAAVWLFTRPAPPPAEPRRPDTVQMVYLQQPGPGGGGGGSPEPAPPKPVVIPRSKPPAPIPITPPPPTVTPPPPTPRLSAPIMTPNAEAVQATGSSTVSLAAYGGGGRGTGIGEGSGRGVGPGTTAGFGGGAYRMGAGISSPSVLKQVKPAYTSEAMRAKIQGDVILEVVVQADGSVGDVRVSKSLDRVNGLDQEAIKAARQWFFRPAVDREGKPVPIIVELVLTFNIH